MPKLSIIIPTFNSASTIQRCLNSIAVQTFTDYEILIQDGGSTDNTLELIQKFQQSNPGIQIKIQQEPDHGAYDAMNKATHRAIGEWLYYLGSDDELFDANTLNNMLQSSAATSNDVLYGNVQIAGTGGWVPDGAIYNGAFDLSKLLAMNIGHQAIFYKAAFARTVGDYNQKFPLLADWDFNMRCWALGKFGFVDIVVAKYHLGGISNRGPTDRTFEANFTANAMQYFNLSSDDPLINSPSFWSRHVADARRTTPRISSRVWRALIHKLGIFH